MATSKGTLKTNPLPDEGHNLFQRFIFSTPMLYVFAIGVWGSTWYIITLQLGVVGEEVSIAYRFCIASLALFLWGALRGKNFSFPWEDHRIFMFKGVALYSIGYFFAYYAGGAIPSGLNAVLFSTIVIFNIFNAALFFKQKISFLTLLGALLGLGGLTLIFLPELQSLDMHNQEVLMGMGFAVLGGLIGSFGNIASMKSQSRGVRIIEANAYSMGYGGLLSLAIALVMGKSLTFDTSFSYVGSLLYLAIFGSIVTFGCYLKVLGRVGADKAAYPMVLIPVVALCISAVFEDYQWSSYAVLGIILMILGNIMITVKGKAEFLQRLKKIFRKKTTVKP